MAVLWFFIAWVIAFCSGMLFGANVVRRSHRANIDELVTMSRRAYAANRRHLRCPGRAVAVIADELGVSRDQLSPGCLQDWDSLAAGDSLPLRRWVCLLRNIAQVAERPRA